MTRGYGSVHVANHESRDAVLDHLPNRAEIDPDHRRARSHGLGHRETEPFRNGRQMQARPGVPKHLVALLRPHWPDEVKVITQARTDLGLEVVVVLNDTGDNELSSGGLSYVDCQVHALVGMNAADEDQRLSGFRPKREVLQTDTVIDRGDVGQVRVAVGIAYRDKMGMSVGSIDEAKLVEREAMHGCDNRCGDEARVSQRHEVVVTVDEVKLACPLHGCSEVQKLPYLRLEGRILGVWPRDDRFKGRTGERITRGEERDVIAAANQSLAQVCDYRFPCPVLTRWRAPGNGAEHGDLHPVSRPRITVSTTTLGHRVGSK